MTERILGNLILKIICFSKEKTGPINSDIIKIKNKIKNKTKFFLFNFRKKF